MIKKDVLELIENYKKHPNTYLLNWIWHYADTRYERNTLRHFIYRKRLLKKVKKLLIIIQ